jgi:thiol-disulfide isomerase/thioredoxin
MKKIYGIIGTLFIGTLFVSCDKTSEDNRATPVNEIKVVRSVLLEEYAGQYCPNCPRAANYVANIKKKLGENLVVVTIHVTGLAAAEFRTTAGASYFNALYPSYTQYLPAGTIDRSPIDGDIINLDDNYWGDYVLKRAQRTDIPQIDLALRSVYNAADSSLTVHSSIKDLPDNRKTSLQLWLTEDHIIAFQYSEAGNIPDYEHNHVLRDAVNGIWGEDIDSQTTGYEADYSLKGKKWKPSNLNIVGFVYDTNTYEVLTVKEIPLITP